jgi:hypothetical protein
MNNRWRTKKEVILEYAQSDPFLKIDDIAKYADTTPRYVRTILSEANISLMNLRKEYARRMEKRNINIDNKLFISQLLNSYLYTRGREFILDEFIFNNPNDIKLLSGNINKEYYYQSHLYFFQEKPQCLIISFIDKNFLKFENEIFSLNELHIILYNKLKEEKVKCSRIELEVEYSNNQIAKTLDIPPFSPLFRVEQSIEIDSKRQCLFIIYFNPREISMSFSSKDGVIIERKDVAG